MMTASRTRRSPCSAYSAVTAWVACGGTSVFAVSTSLKRASGAEVASRIEEPDRKLPKSGPRSILLVYTSGLNQLQVDGPGRVKGRSRACGQTGPGRVRINGARTREERFSAEVRLCLLGR